MNWRFTIIDFTTDAAGVSTRLMEPNGTLYEPIGWTECEIDINRDEDLKGVFFDYSFSSLKWTDTAYGILERAYDNYGIKAHVELLIEYYCPECRNCLYGFFYQAKFNFLDYGKITSDFCYIDTPLETSSDMLTFNSLYDQKVDLENLIGYDLHTPLRDYAGLGQMITLHNKTVLVRTVADNTSVGIGGANFGLQPINYELWNDQAFTDVEFLRTCSGYFCPPFTNVRAIEVLQSFIQYPNVGLNTKNSRFGIQIAFNNGVSYDSIVAQYLVYRPRLLPVNLDNIVTTGPLNMDIVMKGSFAVTNYQPGCQVFLVFLSYLVDSNGNRSLNKEISKAAYDINALGGKFSFDFEYKNAAYQLQPGEGLWIGFIYEYFNHESKPVFTFDGGNFVNIFASTNYVDTPCKVFFLNEVMSRISENITSGALPVVSDYYGRTDSQPYAASADGVGGLRVLTKGLIMRGLQSRQAVLNARGGYLDNFNGSQANILNNINIFALSFQDVFASLDAIDCIGLGLEDDPTRPGKQRLRVERFDYFFQENVIMTLPNVFAIEKHVKNGKFYNVLNFGYDKWETNSYDGLDEFATKRQYRTTFTTVSNTMDKICRFIVSGYAIEYERRASGDSTTDGEFDNDGFLICVVPLSLLVQQMQFTDSHTIYITGQVLAFPVGAIFSISGAGVNSGNYTVVSCQRNIIQSDPVIVFGGDTILVIKESFPQTGNTVSATVKSVSPRLFAPEQGNVTTASGRTDQSTMFMVDPSTVYNWRLSPFRNMMRWMKWLLSMYENSYAPDSIFVFVDGDGNYFATGQQADPSGKMESVDIKESQPLSIQIMNNQADNLPIFRLEEDALTYPMAADQFVAIRANPYGLIEYFHDTGDVRKGWISKISYQPVSGMAKFTLIPKR